MAARTSVAATADITISSAFRFGGPSGKKRLQVTVIIDGATSTSTVDTPWNIGSTAGDLPASVFGLTKIESCSNLVIYTTSTGAAVRVYSAAPDLAGTSIFLSDSGQTAGAVADMALAYTESAMITVVGY